MTDKDIIDLIEKDKWMMDILKTTQKLNLPDWWIGAGFIRSKVWDYLHGYKERTPVPDIDVIYFDNSDFSDEEAGAETTRAEVSYEDLLKKMLPNVNWSVTNQARMHIFHKRKPYINSIEALSEWSETATCIGVKLENNKLVLSAPHGIKDLVGLKLRQIPQYKNKYQHDPNLFYERIEKKRWLTKWPKLKVVLD